jgi:hypothetical protein
VSAGSRAQKKIILLILFSSLSPGGTHNLKGATNIDMPREEKKENYYEGGNL